MAALCAWAASPGEKSASDAMAARCVWVSCPAKDVRGPQMCLGEIWLDAILAPTRLKVHGIKLVDALHPGHGKFDMDVNRLHIYMCFGHGNAGQFMLHK